MSSANDDAEDNGSSTQGLASTRSRRERKDKTGRKAMLEKLKAAKNKGERLKYEVSDMQNVYDEVDEREYEKNVRKRQDDDWIVDDGTGDYFDDGRELFDEEQQEFEERRKMDVEENVKKGKGRDSKKKIKLVKSSNIKNMFTSMGAKKKTHEKSADLAQDELLGDILNEISTAKPDPLSTQLRPVKLKKKKIITPSASGFSSPLERHTLTMETMSPPSSLTNKRIKPRRIMAPTPISNQLCEEPEPNNPQDQVTPPAKRSRLDHMDADTQEQQKIVKEERIEIKEEVMDVTDIDFDDDFEQSQEKKPAIRMEKDAGPQLSSLGWETIKQEAAETPQQSDIVLDSSQLPLVSDNDGNQVFRFYWLDAYEDMYQKPGTVYLFGKVYIESAKTHVSCCVTVKNIEKRVYLLPREKDQSTGEDVGLQDVYKEFDSTIASRYKIMIYKTKIVEKKFVFGESDIPEHSQYVEITYSPEYPTLPQDLSGNTFSHAFGTNQSSLESFLIRRNIKGPSWMDVKMPQLNPHPVSWCKVEACISSPLHITPIKDIPPPPLVVLTFATKTLPNLKTHQNEIIGIAGLVHNQFGIDKAAPKPQFQTTFCALTKPTDCVFPYDFRDAIKRKKAEVEVMPTERMFLAYFLAKLQKIDPDIIIGHNVHDFDLDVLLHRISACKVANWSRIGRLRRTNMPKMSAGGRFLDRAVTCGRILCDVKIIAKELIRCKNYELVTLAEQVLHRKRQELELEHVKNMFESSQQLMWLVEHTWIDATLALGIACELNALPLALQITTIAGNVLSRTLMGGRSERNEFLLLHAFHDKGFLPPDKVYKKRNHPAQKNNSHDDTTVSGGASGRTKNKKGTSYTGGLVLEPKKGFYDKYILLLDFNSLYPSIIQEYNICFTTLDRHPPPNSGIDVDTYIPDVPESGLEFGILPTEIKKLVDRRRQVKQLMKNPSLSQDEYTQYNIRQQALKLTANSMYGCLGFGNSRFYAKPLAALVTRQGREILLHTKELAQKMGLEVIYGDTDSIMINTNSKDMDQVFKLGNQVKAEVNKLYRLLEIDIDGVFKSMLLLKKKKYAALSVHKNPDGTFYTKKELKGLDIVRRDWSELAKLAGNYAVSEILSDQARETIVENIHGQLQEISEKVRGEKYPIETYIINKELTKDPQHYPGKNSLPHVIVALRLNNNMSKHLKSGDVVSYVICKDGTNNPATQRAYAVEEVQKSDTLKIDDEYYLAQQVHPVVMRLCEPVDGTDSAHIAQCLGLDPSGYKQSIAAQATEEDEEDRLLSVQATEEERFSECSPVLFSCPETGKEITLKHGVFAETDPTWKPSLTLECGERDNKSIYNFLPQFQNQIVQQIRADIDRYYKGWLICDDPACCHRTRTVPMICDKQGPVCPACYKGILRLEFTYKRLFQQLCFYKLQFDVDYALHKYKQDPNNSSGGIRVQDHRAAYRTLSETVDSYLKQSAYNQVSLPQLFSWMVHVK
uniref:DNA polymerase alpha catalytic subunit-like n=1 Tax=Styela clava TaxID=7725 RepID=UPI0019395B64|nr:DNA polymerase alpha catalytic subunit-like [Styela clava]